MTQLTENSTPSESDKRYFPRWLVKNRIIYRYDGDFNFHEARSRDLSCTGVSMVSRFSVQIPKRLKLRIYLFEQEHVEVEGHTIWSRETVEGHMTGINFVNTSSEIQNKILQYAFEIKKNDVVNHWFEGWGKK